MSNGSAYIRKITKIISYDTDFSIYFLDEISFKDYTKKYNIDDLVVLYINNYGNEILPLFNYIEDGIFKDGLVKYFCEYENVSNRPYPVYVENLTEENLYIESTNYDFISKINLCDYLNLQDLI